MGKKADQLSYSVKTEDINHLLLRISYKITTKSKWLSLNYILHWSEQCVKFAIIEDRKQKIKDSCYLCLKKGHTAFKCLRNKTCFYCGRITHYHKSMCPKKFPQNITYHLSDSRTQQNVRNHNMKVNKHK